MNYNKPVDNQPQQRSSNTALSKQVSFGTNDQGFASSELNQLSGILTKTSNPPPRTIFEKPGETFFTTPYL